MLRSRYTEPSSNISANRPGRKPKHDRRHPGLHVDHIRRSGLCFLSSRKAVPRPAEDASFVSARAPRSSLREPARSQFRVQSRQVPGFRLSGDEEFSRRGRRGCPGGDCRIGRSRHNQPSDQKRSASLKPFQTMWGLCHAIVAVLLLAAFASAQTLTGVVTNATTNKPAASDDVVLLSLSQGMQEAGRTVTDAKGNFILKLDDAGSPHLIRVIHQGVTYHKMAPPGTTSVEVQVYDVAQKVEGITVTADVMRFQAQGNGLQGIRLFAVENKSNPPRTQMNDQNFEFYLPDGADVDQSMAMTAGGQPVNLPRS